MDEPDVLALAAGMHRWPLRHKLFRAIWGVVWWPCRFGPKALSPVRVAVLRLFGARIGHDVLISPGVKVLNPRNLEISARAAIGAGVDFYNFALIRVGCDTVISQRSWLCTGTHDYGSRGFELRWKPIEVGARVWVAAEAFVGPGAVIEDDAVVGARAVVHGRLQAAGVYAGNPARFVRARPSYREKCK